MMRDRVRVVSLLEESLIPLSLRGVVFAHHEKLWRYGGGSVGIREGRQGTG